DRDEAIRRMRRALLEFQVAGIRTTIPFHVELMGREDFAAGRFDIAWVDRTLPDLTSKLEADGDGAVAAAIAAALMAFERSGAGAAAGRPAPGLSPWAEAGRRAQMSGRLPKGWA